MLNTQATAAIREIAIFLDECGFRQASYQIHSERRSAQLPDFKSFQETLKRASPFFRFLFSVFVQGHSTAERHLRRFLPENVTAACLETGLLARDDAGEYRTPGIALDCADGFIMLVSLPPAYPTATQGVGSLYLGEDTLACVRSLAARYDGLDVLTLGAGSILPAMSCAARGARRVVTLELSAVAARAAQFSALLNELGERIEVREGDLESALGVEDRFDRLIATPTYAPVVGGMGFVGPGDCLALSELVRRMDHALRLECRALVVCHAPGDAHRIFVNSEVAELAQRGAYQVTALVAQKLSVEQYVDTWLAPALTRALLNGRPRKQALEAWASAIDQPGGGYVYYQTLMLERPALRIGVTHVPIYHSKQTDPLLSLVSRRKAVA